MPSFEFGNLRQPNDGIRFFNFTSVDYGLQECGLLISWRLRALLHLLLPSLDIVVRHLYISGALHGRWVADLFGFVVDGTL